MNILALDPGSAQTAWVELAGTRIIGHAKESNESVLAMLRLARPLVVVIEDLEPRQQPLGREVADTLRWVGRFQEAAQRHVPVHLVTRRFVTTHHIDGGTKDADKRIRAALIDRYGAGSERKGGPLYGIVADQWSALAIGLAWADTQEASAA